MALPHERDERLGQRLLHVPRAEGVRDEGKQVVTLRVERRAYFARTS
jgi:hypothetical protein